MTGFMVEEDSEEARKFKELAKKLVAVPKKEVDEKLKKKKKKQPTKK